MEHPTTHRRAPAVFLTPRLRSLLLPPLPTLPPPLTPHHRFTVTGRSASLLQKHNCLSKQLFEMITSSSETLRAGNISTKTCSRVCKGNMHALTHCFAICHTSLYISRNSNKAMACCRFSPLHIAEPPPGLALACV